MNRVHKGPRGGSRKEKTDQLMAGIEDTAAAIARQAERASIVLRGTDRNLIDEERFLTSVIDLRTDPQRLDDAFGQTGRPA